MRRPHSLFATLPFVSLLAVGSVAACGDSEEGTESESALDSGVKADSSRPATTTDSSPTTDPDTGVLETDSGSTDDASLATDSSLTTDGSTLVDGSTVVDSGYDSGYDSGVDSGTCGDGYKNGTEQCDLGTASNTGAYGGCNANCTLAAFCGDGSKNGTEICDLGTANNTGAYGGCKSDCTLADYCGDGVKNGTEACDLGTASNTGAYGGCNADCSLAAYCGDGMKNGAEACDNGTANNSIRGTCSTTCTDTTLIMWLDASDPNGNGTVPADNAKLTNWVDKAGGLTVTQADANKQPLFKTTAINNKPAFLFDGNDDYYDANIDINGSLRPNLTIVTVFQNSAGNTDAYSGVWGQDNGGWDRFAISGGTGGLSGVSNGGGMSLVTGITGKSTGLVFTTVFKGSTANGTKAYINGTLAGTFTGSVQPGTNRTAIGSINGPQSAAAGYTLNGSIAEVLIYNSALSDVDRTALETILNARYIP